MNETKQKKQVRVHPVTQRRIAELADRRGWSHVDTVNVAIELLRHASARTIESAFRRVSGEGIRGSGPPAA